MGFFSIDAYSSIWFWTLLIIAWLIAIDKFSGHSHYKWLSASNRNAAQQREMLRSFYLKSDYIGKYKNNSLILLPVCFFSFSLIGQPWLFSIPQSFFRLLFLSSGRLPFALSCVSVSVSLLDPLTRCRLMMSLLRLSYLDVLPW